MGLIITYFRTVYKNDNSNYCLYYHTSGRSDIKQFKENLVFCFSWKINVCADVGSGSAYIYTTTYTTKKYLVF